MATPVDDFQRVLGALWRFARALSYGLIALLLLFAGLRLAEGFAFFQGLLPGGGFAFLLAVGLLLWGLLGRPIAAFLRVPVVLRPPAQPPPAERTPRDLLKHLDFLERYLAGLLRNPEWEGAPADVEQATARVRALAEEVRRGGAVEAFARRIAALERDTVGRLLEPLDRKARVIIRQEATAVGIATAVSWNGTLDAFIVLWRNLNLVSRLARVYYGRPGPRGTLAILRDVSAATLASAWLQDLSEAAGSALGGLAGKGLGALAGPLLDGGVNAVVTLRVGYLARQRCRAFEAWNERTRAQAVKEAFVEAALFSRDVVADVLKAVGGGILQIPGKVLGKVGDALGSLWRRWTGPEPDPAPGGAAPTA